LTFRYSTIASLPDADNPWQLRSPNLPWGVLLTKEVVIHPGGGNPWLRETKAGTTRSRL